MLECLTETFGSSGTVQAAAVHNNPWIRRNREALVNGKKKHCLDALPEIFISKQPLSLKIFEYLSLQKTAKLQLFGKVNASHPAKLWTLEQSSKQQNITWHFYCVIHRAVCLLLFRSTVVASCVKKKLLEIPKVL